MSLKALFERINYDINVRDLSFATGNITCGIRANGGTVRVSLVTGDERSSIVAMITQSHL